ncbi:hypothetical protein D3C74_451980 [compost metagenome]
MFAITVTDPDGIAANKDRTWKQELFVAFLENISGSLCASVHKDRAFYQNTKEDNERHKRIHAGNKVSNIDLSGCVH